MNGKTRHFANESISKSKNLIDTTDCIYKQNYTSTVRKDVLLMCVVCVIATCKLHYNRNSILLPRHKARANLL